MTNDPDSVTTLKLSNAARMVLNAIATETGPLTDTELFLAGCEVYELLTKVPNILQVGEKPIDIPRALHAVSKLDAGDPQRVGVEQLAMQWRELPCEIAIPGRKLAVLKLQLEYILANQGRKQTIVDLSLTPNCAEAVRALTEN